MPKAPWERERGLDAVLRRWRADPAVRAALVLHEPVPARAGDFAPLPEGLAPGLRDALRARGVTRLYAHQARAYALATAGRHVVVATPTASGKSLCYNLPVAQRLAAEPGARALYLFPTKALARDQELALQQLLHAAGLPAGVTAYDGDTPADARRAARDRAAVVVTNPDMLHAGILPHHAAWARLLAALRYVVVDELHAYAGVFGSHVANVLRRLRRLARFHGSDPVFVCASATVGNPGVHARRLTGVAADEIETVTASGAPAGARHVMVYNPPVVNPELGIRASYTKAAVRLAADLVRAGVATMVFGQSRNTVETMLRYLRDRLLPEGIPEESLQAYRGGYLPTVRRRIEQGLRAGDVRCVVATTALELGIDVGELDAVVCAGYPGTLAGTWQRFGRAGRRGAPSLALLVTSGAPVDQYLARNARYLLGTGIEEARIDPANVEVLLQHVKCAAFELPFAEAEGYGDLGAGSTGDALDYLAERGLVHKSAARWHWVADQYPAAGVSLRNVGWDNVVVIDSSRQETLAEIDWRGAHTMLHEHAVYQHEGRTWLVERFDPEHRRAYVTPSEPDYFTEALTRVRVAVLEESARGALGGPVGVPGVNGALPDGACGFGEVNVVTRVVGFRRVRFHTHENLGYGELVLPEIEMQTAAFWLTLPEALVDELAARPDETGAPAGSARVFDGLRGLAHALEAVTSLALMCAPRDLGYSLGDREAAAREPTIYLYDAIAGGVGLAERAFERRDELLARTLELVTSCGCSDGCPACVSPGLDAGTVGRKRMALAALAALGVTRPA